MKAIDPKMYLHYVIEWYKHHKIRFYIVALLTFMLMYFSLSERSSSSSNDQKFIFDNSAATEALLIYVYANTHSHAYENLAYFINNAVREGDGVDYFFILQQVDNKIINEKEMPVLKVPNAHYIQHENKCFDFGTYGWFINEYTFGNPWPNKNLKSSKNRKIDLKKYKYFIFMNSSIRGPFFTPYFIQLVLLTKKNYYWYSIFTRRINQYIKLVGCTISCETVPHVQTYLFVTDFTGLSVLLKPGNWGGTSDDGVFGCYATKDHATINSELPASNRILESGYLIDSLLTKYQRVNFSEPHNRFCNGNRNPYKDKGLDDSSLEPYEVVFVKYNDLELQKKQEIKQNYIKDGLQILKVLTDQYGNLNYSNFILFFVFFIFYFKIKSQFLIIVIDENEFFVRIFYEIIHADVCNAFELNRGVNR